MSHPNTLVGITTARIAFNEIPDTPRINTELVTSITGDDSRFIYVLDAFASLAISSLKGQVVAMGLQQDTGIIRITIAENKDVKAGLPQYIEKLWNALRDLSASSDRQASERTFFKTTYVYSFIKLYRRFNNRKWLATFERVFEDKYRDAGRNETKCLNIVSSLMTVRNALDLIKPLHDKKTADPKKWKNLDPASAVPDADWDTLILEMNAGIPDVETLLLDRAPVDQWAKDLKGVVSVPAKTPGQTLPVPLFRAIEKLTSHHRHIMRLFAYTDSALGRGDLGGNKLTVIAKPKDAGETIVTLPTIPGVEDLIRPLLPAGISLDHELELIVAGVKTGCNLDLTETTAVTYTGIVHCECALITKLNLEPHPHNWPVNYIGVSKLSCAACYAWIGAFNATHAVKYQTRGSHGRWYPKWAMPTAPELQGDEMKAAMNRIVGASYRTHFDAGVAVRAIVFSDSTEAKGLLPGFIWGTPQLVKRELLTRTARDERRKKPLPSS